MMTGFSSETRRVGKNRVEQTAERFSSFQPSYPPHPDPQSVDPWGIGHSFLPLQPIMITAERHATTDAQWYSLPFRFVFLLAGSILKVYCLELTSGKGYKSLM